MGENLNRRDFLKTTVIRTSAGLIALNQWIGAGARYVSAASRFRTDSYCEITPLTVLHGAAPDKWTIKYTAGANGLPQGHALAIRCFHPILAPATVSLSSPCLNFHPTITIKKNISKPRVIWIEASNAPLPANETFTLKIEQYQAPQSTTSCAFSILEVDPKGIAPEYGSGLTFYEVPATGGAVHADIPDNIHVVLPTRAQAGQPIKIKLSVLDRIYLGDASYTGMVSLSANIPFKDLPSSVTFLPQDKGSIVIEATPLAGGVIRIQADDNVISGLSNPCVCTETEVEEGVYWGDYHKHSVRCDGFLTPEENYEYARNVAFLDFAALSSHDMMPFPKRGAHGWKSLVDITEAAHERGEFVTFQAYEWSQDQPFSKDFAQGHKVVIFLDPNHLLPLIPYCNADDNSAYLSPTDFFKELIARCNDGVIVVPHHLPLYKWWVFPGKPCGTKGYFVPGLERELIDRVQPVAEVFSRNCGNYESMALKDWIKSPITFGFKILDTFWQDALKEGVRTGVMCGSDNHNFPMGCIRETSLTAVKAPSLTREDIFKAIKQRRTYGTSGPRVFIDLKIGEAIMGDIICYQSYTPPPAIDITVITSSSIDFIEIVKVTPGHACVAHKKIISGQAEASFSWTDPNFILFPWVCYYLRVSLENGEEGAWTSPIWIEPDVASSKVY